MPPVEAPIAISRSVVRKCPEASRFASTASAEYFGSTAGAETGVGRLSTARTRARAAIFTLATISCWYSASVCARSTLGLETKSIAPSSSARSVTSAPFSVSEDTITTGIGCRRMRLARNVTPSMRGISTSSVSTSGLRALILSRAW